MRQAILRLYKDLLRYSHNVKYTDPLYFRYRIRKGFKENKDITDQKQIEFLLQKGQKLLQEQRVV
ncbi:LYR motif-containing protein 5A [Osmia bicornis bicornis]|uniref:LYR motif-containing protein 5A n=1 Tax=Osmia bicornis bicornis TaxID=1437191 RepID=UPI0010F47276|nr:LYR motif-containing protein 5A [Osmia bicornis bicornis]XP_029048878.1 LYR motif-containing protein 5A [Osmia bicornis bicornis]